MFGSGPSGWALAHILVSAVFIVYDINRCICCLFVDDCLLDSSCKRLLAHLMPYKLID